MRLFITLLNMLTLKGLLVGVGVTSLLLFGVPLKIHEETWQLNEFEFFIKKFNKSYTNATLYNKRFEAFKKSLEIIEKLNANRTRTSALYGITPFSDMYEDEFVDNQLQKDYSQRIQRRFSAQNEIKEASITWPSVQGKKKSRRDVLLANLPRKVDWRSKGVVSEVNNQYDCGACWAFSAIETIESIHAIRTGKLQKLSTQQMIDCAGYQNNGCKGGDICSLVSWLNNYRIQISTDEEYPLHLKDETCKTTIQTANATNSSGVHVTRFACQTLLGAEDHLLITLALHGPVAVAVNALTWQNYLGGVIQYHCSGHFLLMNHAVQIVGYDLDAEPPYYIVRNSWGKNFGHAGYLYIAIGSNLCGIANEVTTIKVT